MKKINQTQTISELINSFTFGENLSKGKGFSEMIKYSTLFNFWKDIAGEKIAKYTKPLKIKYSKLHISAKSPVIAQEITLTKQKILNKANTYAQALGFTIKDIVLDYKSYKDSDENDFPPDNLPEFYNENELSDIKINEELKQNISQSISKINILTQEQKEKLINKAINTKKAEIKRMQH